MDSEIQPRITSAHRLVDEIARIGGLERHRTGGQNSGPGGIQDVMDYEADGQSTQGRSLPVAAPDDLTSKLVRIVVANEDAKQDLGE